MLAKWSDCKMYPAKVVDINTNGKLKGCNCSEIFLALRPGCNCSEFFLDSIDRSTLFSNLIISIQCFFYSQKRYLYFKGKSRSIDQGFSPYHKVSVSLLYFQEKQENRSMTI